VLILLPPSEGKTSPAAGPKLDLAALSFPELNRGRTATLKALIDVCAKDPKSAASILGLGPTQADEVRVNALLRKAACAPAVEVYTGVLFDALDVTSLGKPARRRLQATTVISSALFGLVRPDDLIPAYRLSGDVALPGIGAPAAPVARSFSCDPAEPVAGKSTCWTRTGRMRFDSWLFLNDWFAVATAAEIAISAAAEPPSAEAAAEL
jgi:hypothetical protein